MTENLHKKPAHRVQKSEAGNIVSGGSNPEGVIYVDSDTDVTTVVSKLKAQKAKDVKIVVPKNSPALNSGVNLKLLARTAHGKAKNLALITSDPKLITMASAAKILTAPNLNATPKLAGAPEPDSIESATIPEPEEDLKEDLTIDGSEFADPEPVAAAAADKKDSKSKKKKEKPAKSEKNKKIPDFNSFRKKALIGLAVFLLLVLGLFLFFTARRTATLELNANAERLDVNFDAKLNYEASETTKDELKVAKKSGSKSVQQSVPATGQQDIGSKATGSLTITNCTDNTVSVPGGTGVSSGGLTYITASKVTIPASNFFSSGACKNDGKANVSVTAQNAGDQYNASAKSYSVSGAPSGVSGYGSSMTGGTTKIIKTVTDSDVASLKEKLKTSNENELKDELKSQFSSNQKVLEDTFSVEASGEQISPSVGQQADQVSGTVTVNYSMYGVDQEELKKILDLNINDAKKDQNQNIIKNGIDELKLSPASSGDYNFATVAFLGPDLKLDELKDQIAGKKKGEAIQIAEGVNGVNSAKVKITPFWSSTLPSAQKIEIKIEVAEEANQN